jgi:hypothetical protein
VDFGTYAFEFSGKVFLDLFYPSLSFKVVVRSTEPPHQKMVATNYSFGIERDEKKLKLNDGDHTKWTNPLEVRSVPFLSLSWLDFLVLLTNLVKTQVTLCTVNEDLLRLWTWERD